MSDRARTIVALEGVRFAYGGRDSSFALAVDALSIDAGARVACIGPSGTGKTTLVNLVAGIEEPSAGTIRVGDAVLTRLSDTARRAHRLANIGMVFQAFELLPYLTAFENILLPYRLDRRLVLDASVRTRARELARAMSLDHVIARRPDHLSHGERQRTAICRALITQPSLILCDEPTGSLDPATAGTILDLLLDEATARGATVFMVTHDHGVLDRFDRVIEMRDGRVDAA